MKRLHLALGVSDIKKTVQDYSIRLQQDPVVVIKDEYALFRTESLNVSIRKVGPTDQGLRHLGWEDPESDVFSEETDCNGIVWERFSKSDQIDEILAVWPDAISSNAYLKDTDSLGTI